MYASGLASALYTMIQTTEIVPDFFVIEISGIIPNMGNLIRDVTNSKSESESNGI